LISSGRVRIIVSMPWRLIGIACALTLMLALSVLMVRSHDGSKPVSFAILEDYDKGDSLQDVAADFRQFQALGIRTWRGSFGWDDYEPRAGSYDFAWLRTFVALAVREGIALRPYIAYTPDWAARPGGADENVWNNPPARVERFEAFAAALARELARYPNVKSFEIYNEENVAQWWDGTSEEYAEVVAAGGRALRQHGRGLPMLLGGLVFPDIDWIERVCARADARRSFTTIPIHAYPETWTPEPTTVENYFGGLAEFVRDADAQCGRKSIWVNETGFATTPGKTEQQQAAWWVRAAATFLATPRVEHIGVYEIKDLPEGAAVIGDAPNYHLGLLRSDRAPKLAFHTVRLLVSLLDTTSISVEDAALKATILEGAQQDTFTHMFARPDGDRVVMAWTRSGPAAVRLDAGETSAIVEYDLSGRASSVEPSVFHRLSLAPGVPRVFRVTPAHPRII
jgi:polysaccharide biosynthesis protein PslG